MDDAVSRHYERGLESGRIVRGGVPSLELARTLELLERFLPGPPADILDVGGGPGVYAAILARQGYRVELIDAVALHVEQARAAAAAQPESSFTARLGDARALDADDASVDAVLLLGPLYHLTKRDDRFGTWTRHAVYCDRMVSWWALRSHDSRRSSTVSPTALSTIPSSPASWRTTCVTGNTAIRSRQNGRSGSRPRTSTIQTSSPMRWSRRISCARVCSASRAQAGCSQIGGSFPISARSCSLRPVQSKTSPHFAASAPTCWRWGENRVPESEAGGRPRLNRDKVPKSARW